MQHKIVERASRVTPGAQITNAVDLHAIDATAERRPATRWLHCAQAIPLGMTTYKRDWEGLLDAATLLAVPRDPLRQAAHEALTKAGMRGKRFRAWVAGGGAATLLGDITDPVAFNAVVRDAPPQIRADVADALAEAYTAAVASDKAALRKASETPSLPRKRKVTTPPRLDPCVPKGGARTWGRPETPFKVGDRVQARWGRRWFAGVVEEITDRGYEIAWAGEETCNEIKAADVRHN